jgi:hypothetical protein
MKVLASFTMRPRALSQVHSRGEKYHGLILIFEGQYADSLYLLSCRVNMDGTCDVTWASVDHDNYPCPLEYVSNDVICLFTLIFIPIVESDLNFLLVGVL